MAATSTFASQRIRFGLYELDLVARELRREGTVLKLQDRPFDVLVILVERPGEVITRDEFRQRLWSADTFVDFDASLNTSINKLRQTLGDNAENPRFIATAGRRGYRFIAPVSAFQSAALALEPDREVAEAATPEAMPHRRVWMYLGLALTGIALIAAVIGAELRPEPPPRVVDLVQITHDGLLDPWGKITTDGARLFYLDRSGGHWTLMQAPAAGGEAQAFTGAAQNLRVVDISPDRAELLTLAFHGRSRDLPLWLTPVVGGPPQRVGDIVADDAVFSPDGRRIFFNRPDGIYSCELDGSLVKKLVALPNRSEDPQWSKDGRRLRFTLGEHDADESSIWEVGADGSDLHRVDLNMRPESGICCGRWSADGRYFFFNVRRDGIHTVWAIREGRRSWLSRAPRPVQLTFGPSNYGGLIASEDPRRVFVWSGSEQFETARYSPATGRVQPLLADIRPAEMKLSPDGAWLCFAAAGELWRSRADGSQRARLASGFSSIDQVSWSPDSTRIMFHAVENANAEKFYLIGVEGGPAKEVALGSGHNEAAWSAVPETIVLAKWVTEGVVTKADSGIFLLDLKNSRIGKIAGSEDLVHPSLSPDGRYLAAITNFDSNPSQSTRVMLLDMRTQRWNEIAHGTLVNPVRWSADSRFFYYQDILAEDEQSFRYSIAANRSDPFADFKSLLESGYVRCSLLGFAPDGALVVSLRRNEVNIFRLDLELP